jgi:hypothetical protein
MGLKSDLASMERVEFARKNTNGFEYRSKALVLRGKPANLIGEGSDSPCHCKSWNLPYLLSVWSNDHMTIWSKALPRLTYLEIASIFSWHDQQSAILMAI